MNDFGPKRPMPESVETAPTDIAKAKRGRPKKKPDYDRDKEIEAFQAKAVELFGEPYDDRIERSKDAPSIRDVAAAMDTTPLRVVPSRFMRKNVCRVWLNEVSRQ